MARQKQITRVCDRCAVGRERPTTDTIAFGLDGSSFEIDLCGEHAAMFHREFLSWQRLAREVAPPARETAAAPRANRSVVFTDEWRERATRTAELRSAQSSRDRELARQAVESAPPRPAASMPPDAFNWGVTDHALARAKLRGFDIRDILTAAANPEQSYRQPKYGPNAAIHQRGDIAVAVDTSNKTVISVLHRTTEQYDPTAHRSTITRSRTSDG